MASVEDLPSFVQPFWNVLEPDEDPVVLDADTLEEVDRRLRAIEEARAAAVVSGRDYLIH